MQHPTQCCKNHVLWEALGACIFLGSLFLFTLDHTSRISQPKGAPTIHWIGVRMLITSEDYSQPGQAQHVSNHLYPVIQNRRHCLQCFGFYHTRRLVHSRNSFASVQEPLGRSGCPRSCLSPSVPAVWICSTVDPSLLHLRSDRAIHGKKDTSGIQELDQ